MLISILPQLVLACLHLTCLALRWPDFCCVLFRLAFPCLAFAPCPVLVMLSRIIAKFYDVTRGNEIYRIHRETLRNFDKVLFFKRKCSVALYFSLKFLALFIFVTPPVIHLAVGLDSQLTYLFKIESFLQTVSIKYCVQMTNKLCNLDSKCCSVVMVQKLNKFL